jgi:hypothetical protein
MTNRTFAYQAQCDGDGAVNIICPQGIKSYDNLRYGDDGMLYIGRSKRGRPYMVQASYGGTDMVVRHSELKNAKRFEALRWKVLEHLASLVAAHGATIADMKKAGDRNVVRGPYDNAWWEIRFSGGTIEKRVVKIDEENILDAVATMSSQEEHHLLNIYFRQEEQLEKYWLCASRLSNALCGLLRDLVPGRQHQFGRRDAQFIVNGRSYIVDDDLRTNSPDRHWPSPFIQIIDLDKEPAMDMAAAAQKHQGRTHL